jgi:hypothetical protein
VDHKYLTLSINPHSKEWAFINDGEEIIGALFLGIWSERIVDCVNACQGVSADQLKAMIAANNHEGSK